MSTIQDITAIARKALEDSNNATESDWASILSGGLEDVIGLCQKEQNEVEAYHKALNAVLPMFVLDRGFDYNCVHAGLKALARHPEIETDARMAMKIREYGWIEKEEKA